MRRLLTALGVLLLAAAPLAAQSVPALVQEGNRLYREGKLAEALAIYRKAQSLQPGATALHYNIGNVLYRQGAYDKAYDEYRQAFSAPERALAQGARYNAGNTHFARRNWPEAIRSYQEALRQDPSDRDAKKNLELALLRMQEEQKKQQQQQKQDQNQDDNEDQKQNQQPQPQDQSEKDAPKPQPREQQRAGGDQDRISREEALRILDAMKEQDRPPKDPLKTPPPDKRPERDW